MSRCIDQLDEIYEMVKQKYPKARLYEGDGYVEGESGKKPEDIKKWRFVFWAGNNDTYMVFCENGTITDQKYIPEPWLEDVVIDLPLKMTLDKAVQLLNSVNCGNSFKNVTIRQPLYPGIDELYYIFRTTMNNWVFVGMISDKVHCEPIK